MPESDLRLIKRWAEFQARDEVEQIPHYLRGIYVLLRYRPRLGKYDVVYIGLGGTGPKSGMQSRIRSHLKSKRKEWTHFSIFEVWDNIQGDEIKELEGLFRHIYRKDTRANRFNRQRSFKKLRRVRNNDFSQWPKE